MANMILLYDNAGDEGTLEGGNWVLPLTYMQDPRTSRRARTNGLTLAATQFKVSLTAVRTFKAIVFGPTNFNSASKYRIRGYNEPDFTSQVVDTGWVTLGTDAVPSLTLPWRDPNFWSGLLPIDDPDKAGVWVIHVFDEAPTAKYWHFEIDDQANSAGFIEIGRLFMGLAWQPSINYAVGNRMSFQTNTSVNKALGGSRYYSRRRSERKLVLPFPYLPEQEVWDDVYRIQAISNLNKQVFIIPDPDDVMNRNKRSFLGNFTELPEIEQLTALLPGDITTAGTSLAITEAI